MTLRIRTSLTRRITGRSNSKEKKKLLKEKREQKKRKLLKKKGTVKETAEKGGGPERPYEKKQLCKYGAPPGTGARFSIADMISKHFINYEKNVLTV